jgi:hypothetical protein
MIDDLVNSIIIVKTGPRGNKFRIETLPVKIDIRNNRDTSDICLLCIRAPLTWKTREFAASVWRCSYTNRWGNM